jgi:hypothetical protein
MEINNCMGQEIPKEAAMANEDLNQLLPGVPASLPTEVLDKLADIVIARLAAQNIGFLPSKQGVAGSSPVSRSTGFKIVRSLVGTIAENNRRYLAFLRGSKVRIQQTLTQLLASRDYWRLMHESPRGE